MTPLFVYGTLCHLPLMHLICGREVPARPARLADHATYFAVEGSFPLIVEEQGSHAHGLLFEDLTDEDLARLDFYEGGFDYHTRRILVEAESGGEEVLARVFFPSAGVRHAGRRWDLADWTERWMAPVMLAASVFMSAYGRRSAEEVLRRYPMMLTRAASQIRARRGEPTSLRRRADAADIEIDDQREAYAGFFAVEEYDLRFRRFDGAMSETVNRSAFIAGDAATVLPYDPHRDRVLLIEQFRVGPLARGDSQPWLLEPIAGRIDAGESPEDAARREAVEEAGLTLGSLLPVARYYPSPGALSEYLYSYVGLADLPDSAAGLGGEESEAEDIRAHLLSFDALMALVDSGEADNAPLILTAQWLERNRARLRSEVGAV